MTASETTVAARAQARGRLAARPARATGERAWPRRRAPTGLEEEWRRTSLDALPWAAADSADAPHARRTSCRRTWPRPGSSSATWPMSPASSRSWCSATWAVARRWTHTRTSGRSRRPRWSGGTFLYVPRGVTVDETLVARIDLGASRRASFPVSLVVAEEGSSVALLEEIRSRRRGSRPGTAASPTWWRDRARACATPTCSGWATPPGTSARSASRSARTPR